MLEEIEPMIAPIPSTKPKASYLQLRNCQFNFKPAFDQGAASSLPSLIIDDHHAPDLDLPSSSVPLLFEYSTLMQCTQPDYQQAAVEYINDLAWKSTSIKMLSNQGKCLRKIEESLSHVME